MSEGRETPLGERRNLVAQLRSFCRVARLRSMARAAEALEISEPSVSVHVRDLEHALDARLLERTSGGTVATPEGERLRALAEPLVEAFDGLPAWLTEPEEAGAPERVEVAASALAGAWVLPAAVARARAARPGLTVGVHTAGLAEALAALEAGTVELALGEGARPAPPGVAVHALGHTATVLVAAPGHPLAQPATWAARANGRWQAVGRVAPGLRAATRIMVETRIECADVEAVKGCVAAGAGVGAVPALALDGEDGLVVLEEAGGGRADALALRAFTRRGAALTREARQLLEALVSPVPAGTVRA